MQRQNLEGLPLVKLSVSKISSTVLILSDYEAIIHHG